MEILLFVGLMVSGQILFKAASMSIPAASNPLSGLSAAVGSWKFLLALGLYAAGTLLWMTILKKVPLSTAYPISMGLTIALTFLASNLIFGETFATKQAIGAGLIIAGIIAMSR